MNKRPIIVVEYPPNNYMRTFHTRFLVSESRIECFKRPLRESSEQYLHKVGEPGITLVRKIMSIQGVTEVCIEPYEITVTISKAYSFEELGPKLREALKSVIPAMMLKDKDLIVSFKPINEDEYFFTDFCLKVKTIFSKITNWFKNIFK